METQDGFIIGVYNYCDRWCERCSLASRCRVFAEGLRMSLDVPATVTDGDLANGQAPVLRSLGALAAAFEEVDSGRARGAARRRRADVSPPWPKLESADAELHRARARGWPPVWAWLAPEARARSRSSRTPRGAAAFGIFIGPKIYRA